MTTPATSKVVPKKESAVSINANGTEYKMVSILFNSRGESRFIDSNCFEGVTFETYQTSPFLLGSLIVVNDSNMDSLNKLNFKSPISNINEYGDGNLFLKIKITFLDGSNKTVTLIDKFFVVKSKIDTVQDNIRQTVYYFVDIIFNHLNNKRQIWSTDLLNQKHTINQYGEQTVNAGRALKHLLETFTGQKDIIDEANWDDGHGKIYYTLPAGTSAIVGISKILKSYVSSDNCAGVFTYYNGKFQLKSLKKHITELYNKEPGLNQVGGSAPDKIKLSNSLAAVFKIQTNDLQQEYSNKSTVDLFGRYFNYIPISLQDIRLKDIQPDSTINKLAKNEVIQFNTKSKQLTIHSDQGTINRVEEVTGLQMLPDGNDSKINIDSNEDYNIKKKMFILSHDDSTRHLGTIKLQNDLFSNLTKASFTTTGNINLNANKFIYMTIDLKSKNEFAKKIPGFWYITKNLTTLGKSGFASSIECVKLDKPK
tara:strand:+ start:26 stop:1468 length:1443 start_codon:yes stop_codon:yes gene_type:complete